MAVRVGLCRSNQRESDATFLSYLYFRVAVSRISKSRDASCICITTLFGVTVVSPRLALANARKEISGRQLDMEVTEVGSIFIFT